ncbi:MAG TPA: hypothetical protein VM103_02485 [Candidatus Paceibacterota bacterium]|nr:hypothetical protein [Candidatus Paceibacterota bacterium]
MLTAKRLAFILFFIGLIVRLCLLPTPGSSDLVSYERWGDRTYTSGLAESFDGVYFPIQYLIFAGVSSLHAQGLVTFEYGIKIVTLLFEIGTLTLLVALTRKRLAPWIVVGLYWLNPFHFFLSQQGYVDPQFSFFILLALWLITKASGVRSWLTAGIPLGVALLMKPQAIPLFIGLGLLFVVLLFKRQAGAGRLAALALAPLTLVVLFSIYFGLSLKIENHHTLTNIATALEQHGVSARMSEFIANSSFLIAHYAHVPDVMPALNANMPNAWFFVANYVRSPGQPIYRVTDTSTLFGVSYRSLSLFILLVVIGLFITKIAENTHSLEELVALTLLFVPIAVPYLTTSAHENHFYFGFMATIVLGAWLRDRLVLYAGYALGVLNALNLFFLYLLPRFTHVPYDSWARMAIGLASTTIFFILLYHLLARSYSSVESTPPAHA